MVSVQTSAEIKRLMSQPETAERNAQINALARGQTSAPPSSSSSSSVPDVVTRYDVPRDQELIVKNETISKEEAVQFLFKQPETAERNRQINEIARSIPGSTFIFTSTQSIPSRKSEGIKPIPKMERGLLTNPEQHKALQEFKLPGMDIVRNFWFGSGNKPEILAVPVDLQKPEYFKRGSSELNEVGWNKVEDLYQSGRLVAVTSPRMFMAQTLVDVGSMFALGGVIRIAAPAAQTFINPMTGKAVNTLGKMYKASKVVMGGSAVVGVGADVIKTGYDVSKGEMSAKDVGSHYFQFGVSLAAFSYGMGGKGFSPMRYKTPTVKSTPYKSFRTDGLTEKLNLETMQYERVFPRDPQGIKINLLKNKPETINLNTLKWEPISEKPIKNIVGSLEKPSVQKTFLNMGEGRTFKVIPKRYPIETLNLKTLQYEPINSVDVLSFERTGVRNYNKLKGTKPFDYIKLIRETTKGADTNKWKVTNEDIIRYDKQFKESQKAFYKLDKRPVRKTGLKEIFYKNDELIPRDMITINGVKTKIVTRRIGEVKGNEVNIRGSKITDEIKFKDPGNNVKSVEEIYNKISSDSQKQFKNLGLKKETVPQKQIRLSDYDKPSADAILYRISKRKMGKTPLTFDKIKVDEIVKESNLKDIGGEFQKTVLKEEKPIVKRKVYDWSDEKQSYKQLTPDENKLLRFLQAAEYRVYNISRNRSDLNIKQNSIISYKPISIDIQKINYGEINKQDTNSIVDNITKDLTKQDVMNIQDVVSIQQPASIQRQNQIQKQMQEQIQKQAKITKTPYKYRYKQPKVVIPIIPFFPPGDDAFNIQSKHKGKRKAMGYHMNIFDLQIPTMKNIFGG